MTMILKRLLVVPFAMSCLAAAELPVREVILFKHGVGFYSRAGDVKAGCALGVACLPRFG